LCIAVCQQVFRNVDPNTPLLSACLLAGVYFAFAGGLLVATFVDLEHMEIPDEVSLPGAALGLVTVAFRDELLPESITIADAALGAGAGFLFVQVFFVWGYELLTGRRGMGEGDSKLLMMIGAFLGWQGAVFALVAGALQGLVVALVALARGWGRSEVANAANAANASDAADATAGTREGDQANPASPEPEPEPEPGPEPEEEEDGEPPPAWLGHLKVPFGPFLALGALEHFFFGEVLVERWLALAEWLANLVPIGR
jgi:leader peptidase (prepilin peptidase)/N-methyltransferase